MILKASRSDVNTFKTFLTKRVPQFPLKHVCKVFYVINKILVTSLSNHFTFTFIAPLGMIVLTEIDLNWILVSQLVLLVSIFIYRCKKKTKENTLPHIHLHFQKPTFFRLCKIFSQEYNGNVQFPTKHYCITFLFVVFLFVRWWYPAYLISSDFTTCANSLTDLLGLLKKYTTSLSERLNHPVCC